MYLSGRYIGDQTLEGLSEDDDLDFVGETEEEEEPDTGDEDDYGPLYDEGGDY